MFKIFWKSCKDMHKSPTYIGDITYKTFLFSGGEVQVALDMFVVYPDMEIRIEGNIESANQIMELALLSDALHRACGNTDTQHLVLKYIPYARQDSVMNKGEALAIKVFTDILNSLNFASVEVWDAHSDVSLALIKNVKVVEQVAFLQVMPIDKNKCVLVAPDAGANKKVGKVAKAFNLEMVRADKTRDRKTGEITGTVVYSEHIGDKDFLIVDDICDGGRTFIELAKVLRPLTNGKIYLYVTHGIFSKGFEVFDGLIDQIFCPNVFESALRFNDPKSVVYKLHTGVYV